MKLLSPTKQISRREAPVVAQPASLSDRLKSHLSEYQAVQHVMASFGVPADRLNDARRLASDAQQLAGEIALLPGYNESPALQRSKAALSDHWRSMAFNGGVSETCYRVAIKNVLVHLATAQ
jgi:hypothetical protein